MSQQLHEVYKFSKLAAGLKYRRKKKKQTNHVYSMQQFFARNETKITYLICWLASAHFIVLKQIKLSSFSALNLNIFRKYCCLPTIAALCGVALGCRKCRS